jgi:hypothetical protein
LLAQQCRLKGRSEKQFLIKNSGKEEKDGRLVRNRENVKVLALNETFHTTCFGRAVNYI